MFEIVFTLAIALYFIQIFVFAIGVRKKFPKLADSEIPTATVIVAARNEEENIKRCLESLEKLVYPDNKLQIILVDDKSTDSTGKIIDEFIEGKSRFKKITTQKEIGKLKGKTNALANAIQIAEGQIILTTDADCIVAPTWAYTMGLYFTKNVGIVNGYTNQFANSQFEGMQSLDFIYLLAVASGTTNHNMPLSCIGNNMAYRKTAYLEVGGYESLPFSVTEDFNLMFAIHNLKKYELISPLDKDTLVTSAPCTNLKSLMHQKKRWGVGGLKSPVRGYMVMTSACIAHICMVLMPFLFSTQALTLTFMKVFLDFLLLFPVLKTLGIKKELKYFVSFEIYFLAYVLILPFQLLFSKKVVWKGREY